MHRCEVCGVGLIKALGPGRWPKRCPEHPRTYEPKPKSVVSCRICGTEFETHRGVYCSGACRSKADRQKPCWNQRNRLRVQGYYAPRSVVAFVDCRICGELFCGRSSRATVCYSEACKKRANSIRSRPHSDRRRAQRRGNDSELFDRLEVFERDNWICGICELPVDPDARWPDPSSVSLDHIIPLALGGAHSRANTQCAHLYCNNVKGARAA